MTYLLTCSCGKEHSISTSQAGQELKCPCGQILRIPTLRGIRELPQAGKAHDSETRSSSKSAWSGWRGPALAFATGVSLIAAVTATYFLVQRLRIDTSYTNETAIAVGNNVLEEYGPYELSYVWNSYESEGLGPKSPPYYHWWNTWAKELVFRSTAMGCVAVVFGCIAAAIWVTAPKM